MERGFDPKVFLTRFPTYVTSRPGLDKALLPVLLERSCILTCAASESRHLLAFPDPLALWLPLWGFLGSPPLRIVDASS